MTTALLFDRDDVEEAEDWSRRLGRLGRNSILWIDLQRPDESELREVVARLELTAESEARLESDDGGPYFGDFGSYVHITAYAPSPRRETRDLVKVECLVAERWVVTVHDEPLPVLEDFRERAAGSGEIGRLEGLTFAADLLEWVLAAYLAAFEEIELALERFDSEAMQKRQTRPDSDLRRLVELRLEIGGLRRALVSHRETFLALTRPELQAIASSDSAERFASLRSRLEEVVQAARDSRESVVGSFDVLIARTEQRTNEIVKVLTLASVILLPGALVAGVMGMNFRLGLFQQEIYFWIVLAAMLVIACLTLAAARASRWI